MRAPQPIGFKNGTNGGTQIAVDAIRSASQPHSFLSVTKQGVAAIVHTAGNPNTHLILRGGSDAPNYDAESVGAAAAGMRKAGLEPSIMIDCSHANSRKDHKNQPVVAADIAKQIAAGNRDIVGVMIESHINVRAPGDLPPAAADGAWRRRATRNWTRARRFPAS